MKNLVYSILLISILITIWGCRQRSTAWTELNEVEGMIENDPETALAVIDMIDTALLNGPEEKARFALLKTMAFDKNYIDTTDFSVLQPAIDYYLKHGNADERLRTNYYKGVIYYIRGELDKAVESFVCAFQDSVAATDTLTLARALVAHSTIMYKMYRIHEFVHNNVKAADLFEKKGKFLSAMRSKAKAIDGCILLEDKARADSLMQSARIFQDKYNVGQEYYLAELLSYELTFGDEKSVKNYLEQFPVGVYKTEDIMMSYAYGYILVNEPDSAVAVLRSLESKPRNTLRYKSLLALANEMLGDYETALSCYKDYYAEQDSMHLRAFRQDLQFADQKYSLKIDALNEKQRRERLVLFSILGLVVSLFIMGLLYHRIKIAKSRQKIMEQREALAIAKLKQEHTDKEILYNQMLALEGEFNELQDVLREENHLSPDVEEVVRERSNKLNELLLNSIIDKKDAVQNYMKWISELIEDRDKFMNSTRIALTASHPKLIKYLESHGLTIDEINYLCLYSIGLRGKEIGFYTKKKSHYNMSSEIRKKLGIDNHSTNLGIYIRKLMTQM